jgi:hypothetical protein
MKAKRQAASILIVFLIGSFLLVLGAAKSWDEAGFGVALGLVLILLAHTALTIRGRSLPSEAFRKAMKREQQLAEAVKVGDRIQLHDDSTSIDPPPNRWELVEVIAILPWSDRHGSGETCGWHRVRTVAGSSVARTAGCLVCGGHLRVSAAFSAI